MLKYKSRRIAQAALAAFLFVAGIGAKAQDAPKLANAPIPYYVNAFDKVWKTVRDNFWDKNLNGANWQKVGETYRARLPAVKTKAEFQVLINSMLGELHASHTEYITDDDIGFYMLPAVLEGDFKNHRVAHIGVMGQNERTGYRVTAILDGGSAEKAGLRAGDLILAADGQPFTSAGSCRGKAGHDISLSVRREGEAQPLSLTAVPVMENPLVAFLNATQKSARILDFGGKKIAYVHLWTMANVRFREVLEQAVLNKLEDTDGMILDLRDGYGGTPFGYSDVFFTPDIVWEQSLRSGKSSRHTGYDRPMTLLINGGTRSAKEYFTYQFKKSKRATVVGTRTTGAFLGAVGFPIVQDGYLELAVAGLRLDGRRLEGDGVTPDVEAAAAKSYTPQDAQVLKAEQLLAEAIRAAPPRPKGERDVVLH